MISSDNSPYNVATYDIDFTLKSYRESLTLAKEKYTFASYDNIPWGQRFILWRHDCDISLNRGHSLALIEASQGISATYFLNPHCDFYNLFEYSQYRIVLDIIKMGHQIGLHFDTEFHNTRDENDLSKKIISEAAILENAFGVRPVAFSFHNPIAKHLSFEAESYGGLINCYSRRFKEEVPYCSDSNGYWRFRRLKDVLSAGTDSCLQVLTHPGWWQDSPMPPRQRIFRSLYGRAQSALCKYDLSLNSHGRQNHGGDADRIQFLKVKEPQLFVLFDYLWNTGQFPSLFIELWRLHLAQIVNICKAVLHNLWKVSEEEINTVFDDPLQLGKEHKVFNFIFDAECHDVANIDLIKYRQFYCGYQALVHGRSILELKQLKDGCIFLCTTFESLAAWGLEQQGNYNGIRILDNKIIDGDTAEAEKFLGQLEEKKIEKVKDYYKQWNQLKESLKTDEVVTLK